MTKEDWKDFWQWLKKNWLNTIIFFALWLILGLGIYQLLLFVPDSTLFTIGRILSSDSESFVDGEDVRTFYSVLIGLVLNALFFYFYFKRKKYLLLSKDALQILLYLHGDNIRYKIPIEKFDEEKNLAFGLALEAEGITERFDSNIHEFIKILNEKEYGWYRGLKHLDWLILDNIENWIKTRFPKKVYFLRLRLLGDYIQATKQDKYLVYDKAEGLPDDKIMIVKIKDEHLVSGEILPVEFYKLILNEFYKGYEDFHAQPVSFDHRQFRKYFTIEGVVWSFLREVYWLLWNAYECDEHRKNPPATGELLSNVQHIYENKEISDANVSVVLRNAYEALSNANKIYEINVKELPPSALFELDTEIFAKKELSSGAVGLMLPYLEEAEKFLIEAEELLNLSEAEHWEFFDSPVQMVNN